MANFFFLSKDNYKKILILYQNKTLIGRNKIIFNKSSTIVNKFKNNDIYVYKGNKFRILNINIFNVGFKFGNFSYTRKPFKYLIKAKK